MTRRALVATSVAIGISWLALAACSTGGSSSTAQTTQVPPSTPMSTTAIPSVTVSDTPTPVPSAPSSVASSSAAPSTSGTTVVANPTTCTYSQLTIRVLPGGAEQGHEIAAVTATNSGTGSCVLYGTPGVSLLRNGKPLGQPAQPIGSPQAVSLAPGDTAQALITDNTDCSAAISDTAHVTLPQLHATLNHPLQLRGCSLTIAPFSPAD